ncbi:MAG: hypothetical protein SFX72_09725 [Isosphaeraceae bacterium]|nr:hypothetical protein [Isosphaeraceae bacterium]
MKTAWILALAASCSSTAFAAGEADPIAPKFERRWVWVMCNLQVAKEADRVVALVERAAAAGYNGVVISDYKLNFLDRVPRHYFANAERVIAAAERTGVELIPAVFPIGYANGLLSNDVDLAEGLPVVDAPFVVDGREADLETPDRPLLRNGTMEEALADRLLGFNHQDEPGKCSVVDRTVAHDGIASVRFERLSETPNARLIQTVAVRPRSAYRLSAFVKTQDLRPTGGFNLMAIGKDGRRLTFHEGGIEPTGDWKEIEVVFNSLENSQVNIYVGMWGGREGRLWVDGLELRPLGLVNVLRREGCPLTVKSAVDGTTYREGEDFEPVRDPLLGRVPYEGEYEFRHAAPRIRLTEKSRIRDRERLLVGWYHPVPVHGSVVMCCLTDPKVDLLLRRQAESVAKLFRPKTFFMQHDEMRVAGWCASCKGSGKTPGELLAANARRCRQILREVAPQARVVVWSDMFDPNHNAIDNYYLVDGSLAGSWEGLDRDVVIAAWNSGKAAKSLRFFADRGHEQIIAGYYDSDDNLSTWLRGAEGIERVNGFMYTTWSSRFDDLERYGRAIAAPKAP